MPIEEKLENHDKRITQQDDRLNNHSERIANLEKYDEDKHRRLKEVEESYNQLKEAISDENKETRVFFQDNMNKLWDLIMSRDEKTHESRKMKHEINKTKTEKYADIILKLIGAGGIIYLIAQSLLGG